MDKKAVIMEQVAIGLVLPFAGTALGSACVFFMRGELGEGLLKALSGFAAGVMVAASVWSLLIPALDAGAALEAFAFVPAVIGFWAGTLFLLLLDNIIPHLHAATDDVEGPRSGFARTTLMVLAVTLHNIPEGMAVGVVLASWLAGADGVTSAAALALALGIAIQNFPEGAIISMPLRANGATRTRAFVDGVLSGIVEPIGSIVTILVASAVMPAMPYLLSFAAGAMMYVVVEELVPEMTRGRHSNIGALSFSLGFTLMMTLDVMLG